MTTQTTNDEFCWCAMQDNECAYAVLVDTSDKEVGRFFKENAGHEIRKTSIDDGRELISNYFKRYRSQQR